MPSEDAMLVGLQSLPEIALGHILHYQDGFLGLDAGTHEHDDAGVVAGPQGSYLSDEALLLLAAAAVNDLHCHSTDSA